jgi:hypothetical protein
MRSSFACLNDGFKIEVLTLVGCKPNEVDPRHTAALRLYGPRADGMPQGSPVDAGGGCVLGIQSGIRGLLDLAVSCETVPVR